MTHPVAHDRAPQLRPLNVHVMRNGDRWRVVWRIEPDGDASWDFASEDDARKAAKIIRGWKLDLR